SRATGSWAVTSSECFSIGTGGGDTAAERRAGSGLRAGQVISGILADHVGGVEFIFPTGHVEFLQYAHVVDTGDVAVDRRGNCLNVVASAVLVGQQLVARLLRQVARFQTRLRHDEGMFGERILPGEYVAAGR